MHRKALLAVLGPSGKDVIPGLGGLWLEVSTTDKAGHESDSARILCVGPPSKFAIPKRGDVYQILMGWEDEGGLVLQGRFSFQKARAIGDPETGETISLEFRAADFVDKLKASGKRHYDDATYGDIMKKLAKDAGMEAEVDPELAKIKIGYRLRWDQSPIDFATELSEEVGATVKPAGGKLVAMKRGGGKSGGGSDLSPIIIRRDASFAYEIEIEPRPEVGSVAGSWLDEKTGKRVLAKKRANRTGPIKILTHPYSGEEAAGAAAQADIYENSNQSGSGHFECPGLPFARAEAPVIVSGFGPWIDGKWKAEGVNKVINSRGGFLTTVEVTAGDDKKGEKGK